jgi:acyl carrier protein
MMTGRSPTIEHLLSLPQSERADALEVIVVEEFRSTMLMTTDEELSLDTGFFDLGLTSLRITETKRRLEDLLDCSISANALFNRPTIRQVISYLMDELLVEVFPREATVPSLSPASAGLTDRALVDDVLGDLFRS